MRIYLAGPLFTSAEQAWNADMALRLRAAGHEVFVPQDQDTGPTDAVAIFQHDLAHLDWCEVVVAFMDGEDPDSGTAWECGWAYARSKPVIMVRTDFRGLDQTPAPYNLMLSASATARFEMPLATPDDVERVVLGALAAL